MVALGDALSYDKSKDKGAQYYLKNYQDKKGLVKLTMLDLAKDSKNAAATKQMNDVLNGDKEIVFRDLGKGHWGHAGVSDNTIQLNSDVLDISKESLSKAGFYASVFAREGHLIDENVKAGVAHQAKIEDIDLAKKLTLGAFKMQSTMLKELAKNAGIQFSGEYGRLGEDIKRVAKNENLTGFQATGRDLVTSLLRVDENASAKDKLKHLKSIGYKTEAASIDFAGGEIRTVPGTDGEIEILFNNGKSIRLKNKEIKNGETDFSHLLSGANSQDLLKALGKGATSEGFLGAAVKSFYSQFKQGNPNASNERGSGQHNFNNTRQAMINDGVTNTANGTPLTTSKMYPYLYNELNCRYASKMNVMKSVGLIRPDSTIYEADQLFYDTANANPNMSRLSVYQGRKVSMDNLMVNLASQTDWAKLTGAAYKNYQWQKVVNSGQVNNTGVYMYEQRGHLTTMTKDRNTWIIQDPLFKNQYHRNLQINSTIYNNTRPNMYRLIH